MRIVVVVIRRRIYVLGKGERTLGRVERIVDIRLVVQAEAGVADAVRCRRVFKVLVASFQEEDLGVQGLLKVKNYSHLIKYSLCNSTEPYRV